MDIVVTTPLSAQEDAVREAADVLVSEDSLYFRRLATRPKYFHAGDRVFYVEAGYLRGYAVCLAIRQQDGNTCETTGQQYPAGVYLWMEARSWTWITPLPYPGFQGWRYLDGDGLGIRVVGGWRDPKPEVLTVEVTR